MKVAIVGQMEYFRFHFESDLDDIYEIKRFQLRWNVSTDFYDPLIQYSPDLTLIFRGEFMPVEVVERIPGIKIGISTEPTPKLIDGRLVYTSDSIRKFKLLLGIFQRRFDYIFHYDEYSKSFFESQSVPISGYCPLPIATDVYRPLDVEPRRDILFLGRSTPRREAFLQLLKRDFDTLHIAHGMPGLNGVIERDFLPLISDFKIVLNIHVEDEISWEPRVQHMLACRALMVSEPISPNPYLVSGRDFLCVNSPREMHELCQEILRLPERFTHIRKSGHDQVHKHLRANTVFPRLFAKVMDGTYGPPGVKLEQARLEHLTTILENPSVNNSM